MFVVLVFAGLAVDQQMQIGRLLQQPPHLAQTADQDSNASDPELTTLLFAGYRLIATAALAAGLVLIAATTWVVRGVLGRVNVLAEATTRLTAGELATRVASDTHDELGVLAGHLNELAVALENHARRAAENSSPSHEPNCSAMPECHTAGLCHVLVVEDGPENRRFMNLVLRKAGIEVALADNGREAVDKTMARTQEGQPPFDLILMDMEMPVMNGHDATRMLRQQGYNGRIVAVTGHTREFDRQKCLDAGCDQYVCKPVDQDTLLSVVGATDSRPVPAAHS
jgi:CheY-like chemotaxis protein/HAMP domain-containing protein